MCYVKMQVNQFYTYVSRQRFAGLTVSLKCCVENIIQVM